MNDDELAEKIRALVARRFSIDVEMVRPDTSLFNLAKDSLAIVELVMVLEREFSVEIRDEVLERLGKIVDMTRFISENRRCQTSPSELPIGLAKQAGQSPK